MKNTEGVQIVLTPAKSEEIFHNCLCNAVGTGYFSGYGIEVNTKEKEYKAARAKLYNSKQNPTHSVCYEDVLMQILRDGGSLQFEDVENEGDMTVTVTLKDVHEKVQGAPLKWLTEMIDEEDDAETADCILQHVLYGEIVFG